MSMEICVLSDVRLASIAEWQTSIEAESFPLRLPREKPLSKSDGGNLRVQLRDKETMIEYSVVEFSELEEMYRNVNFGRVWTYVIAFIWSSAFAEEIAAWMAATAYARATGGFVFDEGEGKLLTPTEALGVVVELERSLPEKEVALQIFLQQLHQRK
jgi:hypothetical protein